MSLVSATLVEMIIVCGAGVCAFWYVCVCMYVIITKNFNTLDSHGDHGAKRRELAQHIHSHGSHAFTHTLNDTVTTTWCEALAQLLVFSACCLFALHVCIYIYILCIYIYILFFISLEEDPALVDILEPLFVF